MKHKESRRLMEMISRFERHRPKGIADVAGPYSELRYCNAHGLYMVSTVDAQGHTRYRPGHCDLCERERHSAIPKRFQNASFANYETVRDDEKRALALAMRYAYPFAANMETGRCMTILGSMGTGKTFLACAIALSAMRQGHTALYVTASEILGRMDATRQKRDKSAEEVYSELTRPDLLVIDEVGASRATDYALMVLSDLIDRRSRTVRPMVLAANLTLHELKLAIGERAKDRLKAESGIFTSLSGRSRRA